MAWKFQVQNTENKEKNMKKTLLTVVFTIATSSYAADFLPSSHNWNDGSSDPLKAAIASAKAENAKASKAGHEWRDTGKMIKEAAKIGGKKGIALANAAKHQAIAAQNQAKDQANAGPALHIK